MNTSLYGQPKQTKMAAQIGKLLDLSSQCTQALFVDMNFSGECVKLLASKLLGYLIILGAVFFKIPQILAIIKNKSVAGLSLSMFGLELVGFFITLAYNIRQNNPFSTYGETIFVILQSTYFTLRSNNFRRRYCCSIFPLQQSNRTTILCLCRSVRIDSSTNNFLELFHPCTLC